MMTFVACISAFSSDFGVDEEKYFTAPEDMFENALELMGTKKLLPNFKERAHQIVENACDAWEHFDSLQDCYEEFYGEFVK